MSEAEIQRMIMQKLSEYGAVFRINNGGWYTKDGRYVPPSVPPGFSDLIFCRDGRITFIEVKTPTGKVSKEQINFLGMVFGKYGCNAGVARSVEDALKLIGEVQN